MIKHLHVMVWLSLVVGMTGLFSPFRGLAGEANQADSDTPADYASTLSLSVTGKQGVVSYRLPPEVYLNAHSAELNDLRLFDAAGGKLPFALYVPSPPKQTQKQSWPVKQFPVNASSQSRQSVDAIELDIKTGANGKLLSVKSKSSVAKPDEGDNGGETVMVGLILDVGRSGHLDKPEPISALKFVLPPRKLPYSAQVWLEVSDNLKQWEMIAASELTWLVDTPTAETLVNDRLEFVPHAFRYARLSWRSGEPLRFASITAESAEQTTALPNLEQMTLSPVAGRQPGDLMYLAGAALPVEKIALHFTEPNIVLPAQVGTYRERPNVQLGKSNEWVFQPLTRAVFYQINQSGQARRSSGLSIPQTHYAEWVLHPTAATASKPVLTLYWQPATLVFLASGPPPYALAFGRDIVKSAATDLSQVAPGFSAQELLQTEQAQAAPGEIHRAVVVYDSEADTAEWSAETRTLLLWGVLLLGVVVLGMMAWRLVKQMK